MLRFDKPGYLSLVFKFILSERLGNSLWGLDVLLFSEFINIILILYHNFIELFILLYAFPVISFAQYKEYITWQISISKFSYVFPAFTCGIAFFFNWDSLHVRLNSHYKAQSYKKKKHMKIKGYRKPICKEPIVNMCLLILDLKAFIL